MNDEDLRKYIIERVKALKNKHDWDYGFTNSEQIVNGLRELRYLASKFRIDITPYTFTVPDWIKQR